MGYILILIVSVGLAGTPLNEREESNKDFRKKFKAKYGYEWGSYGFNMDSEWEATVEKYQEERVQDRDEEMDMDGEPSMNGGNER
tara:strand:- start:2031 stop:2285 length:255 start_codon:yes stop_codon:yes gene_type:complete